MFSRNDLYVEKFVFESLIPGAMVHYGVIDTWASYLNYMEEFKLATINDLEQLKEMKTYVKKEGES